jgi:hypothetical protein
MKGLRVAVPSSDTALYWLELSVQTDRPLSLFKLQNKRIEHKPIYTTLFHMRTQPNTWA